MAEVTLDDNIYIKPSEELQMMISELEQVPEDVTKALLDCRISVDSLKSIQTLLNVKDKKKMSIALRKSEICLPSPEFPERNPELEARCQQLRREQEDREYKELTKNVRNMEFREAPLSNQMREMNAILIALLQFVISVACAFAFGFLVPYYFFASNNTGAKILCGTFAAFIVGFADLYFVIKDSLMNDGINVKKVE